MWSKDDLAEIKELSNRERARRKRPTGICANYFDSYESSVPPLVYNEDEWQWERDGENISMTVGDEAILRFLYYSKFEWIWRSYDGAIKYCGFSWPMYDGEQEKPDWSMSDWDDCEHEAPDRLCETFSEDEKADAANYFKFIVRGDIPINLQIFLTPTRKEE